MTEPVTIFAKTESYSCLAASFLTYISCVVYHPAEDEQVYHDDDDSLNDEEDYSGFKDQRIIIEKPNAYYSLPVPLRAP